MNFAFLPTEAQLQQEKREVPDTHRIQECGGWGTLRGWGHRLDPLLG